MYVVTVFVQVLVLAICWKTYDQVLLKYSDTESIFTVLLAIHAHGRYFFADFVLGHADISTVNFLPDIHCSYMRKPLFWARTCQKISVNN